jgi:integrase/recombinase XerD
MQNITEQFKTYLEQAGYSESTCHMLPALVREFIEQQAVADISYIERNKVKQFCAYLQTRPLKYRSGALSEMMISHYMYALRTFFSWLQLTEQADHNPISGMKFKRPQQNTRQPLTIVEVKQLFASARSMQEQTVLHLFYSCGLRRSEGEMLHIQDIHFKQCLLYVREGKGAKRRVIPLTQKVAGDLEAYCLQERTAVVVKKVKDQEAFMLNSRGRRMRGEHFNSLLKAMLERAAIDKPDVSLHHLRHSIATHLLQGGMSLEYVRDFLGHRFLETTQIYARPKAKQLQLL